jgi:hypothetical protein
MTKLIVSFPKFPIMPKNGYFSHSHRNVTSPPSLMFPCSSYPQCCPFPVTVKHDLQCHTSEMKSLTHWCCRQILQCCTNSSILFLFSCNLAPNLDTLIAHCAPELQQAQYGVRRTVVNSLNLLKSR